MDDVAKLRGLHLRGKVYYSRVTVPRALVSRLGRSQIWKSLHTSVRGDAEALHLKEAAFWAGAFAEMSRPDDNAQMPAQIDDAEAEHLARRFFERARADLDRGESPAELDEHAREVVREDILARLSTLGSWRNPDTHLWVSQAQNSVLNGSPRAATTNQLLSELMRRALVQLGSLELARLQGDFSDEISDSFFRETGRRGAMPARAPKIALSECIRRFQEEALRLRPVTVKTSLKHDALLRHIEDFFGSSTDVATISRSDCNRYRDALSKLVPNAGKASRAKKIGSTGAVGNAGTRTLSWETQNNYLKMLSDMLRWAKRERLVEDNAAEGIVPLKRREAAETQRLPFNGSELRTIFAAPLFVGCLDDEMRFSKPGPNIIRRSRYWLPLIALYSGMRMGEILQLTPDHVRRSERGTAYFVLTRDMKLKTASAEREVPVHPELERLGFLDWVAERRAENADLLFRDVPESKHGYRSDTFTKRFATFLRSLKLPADRKPKLCFHSFRHTFKDALNETSATEEIKDEICGWARGKKTGRRYGSGLSADRLKPFVDEVAFPVDLARLRAAEDADPA